VVLSKVSNALVAIDSRFKMEYNALSLKGEISFQRQIDMEEI
jgi:hypothetical protein